MSAYAEQYANRVVEENYSDDPEVGASVDLDEGVDPPARYRDMKAWLQQGYEAGYADALRDIKENT